MSRLSRSDGLRSRGVCAAAVVSVALVAPDAGAQPGACCLSNGNCISTDQAGCATLSGEYMGVGTLCADVSCQGACCLPDGTCTVGTADACAGGTYQGAGSTCQTHCPATLGAGFLYQGRLEDSGAAVTDSIDVQATLWASALGGTQVGGVVTVSRIDVVAGVFTVRFDFGVDIFDGDARWLQIAVRRPHDPTDMAPFTTLSPRQPVAASPYALALRGVRTRASGSAAFPDAWNVIGGSRHNAVAPGLAGATISGGGTIFMNQVLGDFGTVGGGLNNAASGLQSTIAGGASNSSAGTQSAVGGGGLNMAGGANATVPGGRDNEASGDYSLAAGRRAKARHPGSFVWADSTDADFASTRPDQFLIRAAFGVGIGTNLPSAPLHVTTDAGTRAILGVATATTGGNTGVYGQSNSTTGRGVTGWAASTTGLNIGVLGRSSSTGGAGVQGEAEATNGLCYGVFGRTESRDGRGVFGLATATSGSPYGVYAVCNHSGSYDFFAAGNGMDYGTLSSARWKRNVQAIDDPLGRVARLRGVRFDWDEAHGGRHDVGMIAEEVGEVLPEIVQYEENGVDATGLDYSKLTPLLVEAVKALRAESAAELTSLRLENEALRRRLERLEGTAERPAEARTQSEH